MWTAFHFARREEQGSTISGLFQWLEWLLNIDVSKENTSFFFDCEEVLESLKIEVSKYENFLFIVYYFEGKLNIQ
jgi:hypothetical protein